MYIGKTRFQRVVEAKRRRLEQSASNSVVTEWAISEVRKRVQNGPVLDLACGNGRHSGDLARGVGFLCAGDISLPMLREVRRNTKDFFNIHALRFDAESLPYADNTFDVTFSARFFHHLPQPVRRRVLEEIFRVSRNAASITLKKRFSFEHFRTAVKYFFMGKPFQYQRYFTSVIELDRIARTQGWRVVSSRTPIPFFSANCAVLFEPIPRDQ